MACYLTIWGKFDPDALAVSAGLPVKSTWREGSPARRGRLHEDSGLSLVASSTDFNDYRRQFAEAEAFLREHREALTRLTTRADTLESVLDFGLLQVPYPAYFRRLPASLVQVAAELRLSIELSFYAFEGDDVSSRKSPKPDAPVPPNPALERTPTAGDPGSAGDTPRPQ